ncbi:Long-chain-fatty-acid--CoA ligase (plasmid) [Variovorax sp. SRS16]|uniref:class I adenylate-forming enzyme family protein n=1 Tax=Variovorax sp. SRS16 TaxID=282217 RepID=UPI001317580D|nr:AMP-binding protein [Variovorax sp. SRS16]VTU45547.1 Long-chain-fatty-acid--CoA ligase [Variovorax sp. SRS16]
MEPSAIIRRAATSYAACVAVSFEGREQTYKELFDRACRLANAFISRGAAPGDRVAVLSDNAFETIEIAAACALANCARATLYTYNSAAVNRYLLGLTGARILVIQAKYFVDIAPLLGDLPELKAVLVYGGPCGDSAEDYESAIAAAEPKDPAVPVRPDDVHIIRFSSGTTGKPKGIFHTVQRWEAFNNEWAWVTPTMNERSRYLVPIALAHLGVALLWSALAVGARIVPMIAFDPRRTLELIASEAITHAAVAPVMIREMVAQPEARSLDLSSLQCLLYAGSPIAPATLRAAIEIFGPCLHQLYGQSEAVPATMLLPHQHVTQGTEAELRRLRSVGRASANVSVTIRDEKGHALPAGEIGEIAVLGPSTMSGIWGDPDATVARKLADGSVLTRDMGYLDEDGFLYLVDRKDDMIISGGFNIWPTELESALHEHPAVAEACVFGIPDAKWGETPRAVVVLRPGAQVSAEELTAHTRSIVGGVKKVTSIDFTTELPRTANGKVQRSQLKAPFWSGHASRIAGS